MEFKKTSIRQKLWLAAVILTTLAAGSTTAWATAIPITDAGVLQIGNSAGTLFGITSSPGCINWAGGSTCVAGTTHSISVSGSSNLFSTPSTGTIQDLTSLSPTNVTSFENVSGAGAL